MKTTQELATRFNEVLFNGTWIANTNYKKQLEHLTWEVATTKIGSLNTIAVLSQHIHYYIAGVSKVLKGGELIIRDADSFNFPPVTSQKQWDNFLIKLWKDAATFTMCIEAVPQEELNMTFVKENYGTYLRNINGIIEHCYYHLGQIVLIKKLIENKET